MNQSNMKVLVVGGGGREHAIVWKLAQSKNIAKLFCTPGNGGIAQIAECVPIQAIDIDGVVSFAKKENMDLVFVASDDPLALGMVDALHQAGVQAFGPVKAAAIIEASKEYAKNFMKKYNIPTAAFAVFADYDAAISYLQDSQFPIVVKADGLALGKGAVICASYEEAESAVRGMMCDDMFGKAGKRVVIEEYLQGSEVTVLAFADGKTVVPMVSSKDHKRAFDNDEGLNTGGMGAISPCREYTDELAQTCMQQIYLPTIQGLASEGRKFQGVIYFEMMLTAQGPKVIEYNARFGDPEAQIVLMRLKTDLLEIVQAIMEERLDEISIEWEDGASACVVAASGGYPLSYPKGMEISGLETFESTADDVVIFHAGTQMENGKYVTSGGRVLAVSAKGTDLEHALAKAYEGIGRISFEGMFYRSDIGKVK